MTDPAAVLANVRTLAWIADSARDPQRQGPGLPSACLALADLCEQLLARVAALERQAHSHAVTLPGGGSSTAPPRG